VKTIIKTTFILLTISFTSCFYSTGTHGSIKYYNYATTKDKLENAVIKVIKSNHNIYPDTIKNYMIDVTNGKHDTIHNDYYNDSKTYKTMKIKVVDEENEYTFRYYGGEEDWKTSKTSGIFICYAYDKNGQGG
jgi:hypothetical protein